MRLTLSAALLMFFTYSSIAKTQPSATSTNSQTQSTAAVEDSDKIITAYRYILTDNMAQEIQDIQSLLKTKEIGIISIESGYDGLMYLLQPEEPSSSNEDSHHGHIHQGHIFILQIKKSDWQKLTAADSSFDLCSNLQEKGGDCHVFHYSNLIPKLQNKSYVSIYKHSNQIQCHLESGQTLQEMEQELIAKNIVVYRRYRGVSGEFTPVQCGNPTNFINIYVIEKSKLGIALSIGFAECALLKVHNFDCYRL